MNRFRFAMLTLVNFVLLPAHLAFAVLATIMTFIPIFPTRIGLKNLTQQLKVSRVKAHFLLAGVYLNYCYYLYEIYFLSFLGLIVFDELDECTNAFGAIREKYKSHGGTQGILILGAHYSNFELLGFIISRGLKKKYGMKVYALTKPSRSKLVSAFWRWFRPLMGFHVIETNRSDLFEEMGNQARAGNCISLIADQKPKRAGLFIEFFGTYAAFPVRGLTVLKNANMPVIALASRRIFPGYAKVYYSEMHNAHLTIDKKSFSPEQAVCNLPYRRARVLETSRAEFDEVAVEIMSSFAGWLELVIHTGVTQWFWDYKKWSRKAG